MLAPMRLLVLLVGISMFGCGGTENESAPPQPARVAPIPDREPAPEPPPVEVGELTVEALASVRTSARPVQVRLRVDNRTAAAARLRVRSMTALTEPLGTASVRTIELSTVALGEVYPTTAQTELAMQAWFEVPAGEARIVQIESDHRARYAPMHGRHRYRVELESGDGDPIAVEAELGDGIRHPVRR